MKFDNYRFILADDHKGNKILTIVQGKLNKELVTGENVGEIDDKAFERYAETLIDILNQSTLKKIYKQSKEKLA